MSVVFKYKGAEIGTMSETGEKSLKTAGKYCEANIDVQYIDSGGMAGIHFGSNSHRKQASA